jgi:hypothetical protein
VAELRRIDESVEIAAADGTAGKSDLPDHGELK